ncbi:MAG TPA: exosortase/archaeosortase family protein [Myxococcota bacterium]|nr:exosortase/archaeosortase family protein [Myxococcota bacterium]
MVQLEEATKSAGTPLASREWALVALLAVAFAPGVLAMADVWTHVDYQSHGFLVPVVSVWLAMRQRYALRRLPVEPAGWGLAVLAAAFVAYFAGIIGGSVSLQGAALVAAIAGAVLFARGTAWLRRLALPIAFLLFMVPVPPGWITPLILQLQLFVSDVSLRILNALGILASREGNVLLLPSGESLFVAEACSGVTSIVTLAPLGVLLAVLTLRGPVARVLLVAAVVPLAMAGNLVRVLATVFAAMRVGAQSATDGPPHEMLGLLTYLVAVSLLLALSALLRRVEPGGSAAAA